MTVQSILIGAIGSNRVRLGEAFILYKELFVLEKEIDLDIDFNKITELLSDYTYIYSFNTIQDLNYDIIDKKCIKYKGEDFIFELVMPGKEIINRMFDKSYNKKLIDFEMFNYLNEVIWPRIIELLCSYSGAIKSIKLRIPLSKVYSYYIKYIPDIEKWNIEKNCKFMKIQAIEDVNTWLIFNRI